MYELNQQMKAGRVPGFNHIKEIYADGIHLNNVGAYIVGCTYYATLYRENPKGLQLAPYKVEDAKLAGIIQEAVWKVVSTNELAGVSVTATGSKTSMKGWELYVWQKDGDNYFSLLPGTNRLKTEDEISEAAVKGINAVKPKLDELKPGQEVFLSGKQLMTQPPKDQVSPVVEYGKKIGLKVQ
jgi:hypothetical protein